MKIFLKSVVVGCLFVAVCDCVAADDLSIDSYEFEWKVAKVGDNSLRVTKDEEATRIVIRGGYSSLTMKADDAEKVGDAMVKTSAIFKSMKGTSEKTETVKAGDYDVAFMTTKDSTFYVTVDRRGGFSSVMLDRESAIAFAPHLKRSKAMAAIVDKKINP